MILGVCGGFAVTDQELAVQGGLDSLDAAPSAGF
jgi:hypothetical protein